MPSDVIDLAERTAEAIFQSRLRRDIASRADWTPEAEAAIAVVLEDMLRVELWNRWHIRKYAEQHGIKLSEDANG